MSSTALRKRLFSVPKGTLYEGLVATRGGCLDTGGVATTIMCRTWHKAVVDIPKLKCAFSNFRVPISGASTETGTGTQITTASVEYPTSVFSQMTFGGQIQGAIDANGMIISDYCTPAKMIPAGATFFIRHYDVNSTLFNYCNFGNGAGGDIANWLSSPTDKTMGGTITDNGSNVICIPPTAIIGMTNKPSVIAVGDSITNGLNDTSSIYDFRRGMICKGFPVDTLAFLNHGTSSAKVTDYNNSSTNRRALWKYASHFIDGLGHNAIFLSPFDSAATLEADLRRLIWNQFPPRAVILRATLTPKSTSTGAAGGTWLDDSVQTTDSHNAARVTFNGNIRAGMIGVRDYLETSDTVESIRDNGKWLGDGVTSKKYTPDGIHPSAAGYTLTMPAADMSKIFYP